MRESVARIAEPVSSTLAKVYRYSSNKNRAIEQIVRDVGLFYSAGFEYETTTSSESLNRSVNYLKNKFAGSFPDITEIADYVYTRGEATNPFGPWARFRYELPLAALCYAKELSDKSSEK